MKAVILGLLIIFSAGLMGCSEDASSPSSNAALSGSCGQMEANLACPHSSRIGDLEYFQTAAECQTHCQSVGATCCSWNVTSYGACKAGTGAAPAERTDVEIYGVACN